MSPGADLVAAAIGGGILTLIGETFVDWWRRPSLHLFFGVTPEYCARTPERGYRIVDGNQTSFETESIWLRIKITNEGRSIARSCQIAVTRVSRQNSDGSTERIDNQDAILLPWSLRNWNTVIDLPKGMNQFVDVCFTKKSEPTSLTPAAPNFPFRLEKAWQNPGTFEVGIVVTADNASPKTKTIKFQWDGRWDTLRPL